MSEQVQLPVHSKLSDLVQHARQLLEVAVVGAAAVTGWLILQGAVCCAAASRVVHNELLVGSCHVASLVGWPPAAVWLRWVAWHIMQELSDSPPLRIWLLLPGVIMAQTLHTTIPADASGASLLGSCLSGLAGASPLHNC